SELESSPAPMEFDLDGGDLSKAPLAALLVEALRERATGLLTLEHGAGMSKVYVRDGAPVGAQVFVGFQPLGQFLLARGLIDFEVLDRSLAELAKSGKRQGEFFVESGAITQEALDRALSEQHAGYLHQLAALAT